MRDGGVVKMSRRGGQTQETTPPHTPRERESVQGREGKGTEDTTHHNTQSYVSESLCISTPFPSPLLFFSYRFQNNLQLSL